MDMRVAAYGVVRHQDGRILLAHWNESGRSGWTMPGGGLEDGEDPEDAVRREVREETGYRVRVDELLGIHSQVIPEAHRIARDANGPLHTLRIVYRATVRGGRLRNEVGGSTDRAAWFALDEVRPLHRVRLVEIALGMAGIDY
jgi:8-oxo-dGTP diphosphatase